MVIFLYNLYFLFGYIIFTLEPSNSDIKRLRCIKEYMYDCHFKSHSAMGSATSQYINRIPKEVFENAFSDLGEVVLNKVLAQYLTSAKISTNLFRGTGDRDSVASNLVCLPVTSLVTVLGLTCQPLWVSVLSQPVSLPNHMFTGQA